MRRVLPVLAGLLLALLPCAPASAHGGKVKLEVAGDGAAGVTVRAIYADGHPVDDRILRLVLTATGEGGRSVGPVQLNPAGEGRGFYASGSVLGPGRWSVVVTAPTADAARGDAVVEARTPQTAPPPVAGPAGPGPAAPSGSSGGAWWWLVVAVIVVAAIPLVVRRRRST